MKHYKSLYLFIIIIGLISCKKSFLDVSDKRILTRQEYVVDLKSTGEYLNGVYVQLAEKFYHGYHFIYPELIADNLKPITGLRPLATHYVWSQQTNDEKSTVIGNSTTNLNPIWLYGYNMMRECSFILETIDLYKQEDTVKANNIKGQAYALRALVHFSLVNLFAQSYNFTVDGSHPGIPYITSSDWSSPVSRQTVAQVYINLISDLNAAIQLLTLPSSNPLYLNKNAAKALLARVYLFKEDYELAKNLSKEVSDLVPIMTGNDYPSKLFTPEETEALFQLPPVSYGVNGGVYTTTFAGRYFNPVSFNATKDIGSILTEDPQDKRNTWVTYDGSNWKVSKYPLDVIPGFPRPGLSYYQTLLRSSESCLIAAESYARLNKDDSAILYLDAIRFRANPAAQPTTAAGAALLDSIYKERRKEMSFEGLRMFDLQRWKKGVIRADAPNPAAKTLPYPSNKAIAPLPLSDVSLAGLTQNSGY